MKISLPEKSKLLLFAVLLLFSSLVFKEVYTNVGGAPAFRTGAPSESTCATSSCHSGTLNSGPGNCSIVSDIPPTGYVPGQVYSITATITETGKIRFGFELLAAYSPVSGSQSGFPAVANAVETKLVSGSGRTYVTHKSAGTSGSGTRTWTVNWTAPNPGSGDVTFYACFNAANNDGGRFGDKIYSCSLNVSQLVVDVKELYTFLESTIYPTAGFGDFQVMVRNASASEILMHVYDESGFLLPAVSGSLFLVHGDFHHSLDLSNEVPGMYFIELSGMYFHKVQKVIVFRGN